MKKLSLIAVALFVSISVWSQQADTLIYAEGRILNSATKEAVTADILYQSLPFANTVGSLNGSTYRFPLFNKEKYSITVEAIGFATAKYMLDPAEANSERKVIKDIELSLPVAAVKAAETTHTVGKVMRLDNLIFQQGRAKIGPESYPELDEVAKMLQNYPKMVIQLEGHTDYLGDPKQNLQLSKDRVEAVKTYLTSRGVNKGKIKTKAFGGASPLSRENTEAARTMNRRVEVRILEN
jgi:OmpA-OmpF porin, OOP family